MSLALYIPTVATEQVVNDSHASAATAWRIATTGTPWFDDVATAQLEGSPWHDTWIVLGADNHQVYNRTAGTVLSAVPFYAILNNDLAPTRFEIGVGGVAASTWTAFAGVFLFLTLRSVLEERLALAGATAFLFTTPAWSLSANALWTHNITLFALAFAMYLSTRRRWWMVGLAIAVGILARPHLAVIAAVVGLYLSWVRRDWRIVPAVGLSSAVGLAGLAAWNKVVFGVWNLSGGYTDYVTQNLTQGSGGNLLYGIANVIGFFFAPDRGLFVWTPVILLLLPAFLANRASVPDWVKGFALAGLAYSFVQLRINAFTGGSGFYGYRHGLELAMCLTPALTLAFLYAAKWTRVLIGAVIGAQFVVVAVGAADESYYLREPDAWTGNAFLVALSDRPVELGLSLFLAAGVGALASYRYERGAALRQADRGHMRAASAGPTLEGRKR